MATRKSGPIYWLESVRAMAEEVLGSAEVGHEWLNTEAMGLEFRKPIDLVSTSPGAESRQDLVAADEIRGLRLTPLPAWNSARCSDVMASTLPPNFQRLSQASSKLNSFKNAT